MDANGMKLEDVRERIEADDSGKWDALVHRDDLVMRNGKILVPETVTAEYSSVANGSNGKASQSYGTSSRWLLRAKDGQLRGVLSDRYCKLDHLPLLETLEPLLPSRLEAKWFALTDETMHLRLVDPTLAREVLKDDRLMVGLHISNSEVGKRSVTVDAIVFRLVCSNGLVRLVNGKSLMQQKHIALTEYRMKRSLEKAIGEALTVAAGLLEKMAQAVREPVYEPERAILHIQKKWNLSEAFTQTITDNLLREPAEHQHTMYGFINAVTPSAQSLHPDQRYDVEAKAAHLLETGIRLLPSAEALRSVTVPVAFGRNGNEDNSSATVPLNPNAERVKTKLLGSSMPDVFGQAKRILVGQVITREASTPHTAHC